MQLSLETGGAGYRISAYGEGFITVNGRRIEESLIITPQEVITDWAPEGLSDLTQESLEAVMGRGPEVVLLGTGARQEFPASDLLAALTERGVGVEVMSTAAACRTYNILMAEGRNVAAALLIIRT